MSNVSHQFLGLFTQEEGAEELQGLTQSDREHSCSNGEGSDCGLAGRNSVWGRRMHRAVSRGDWVTHHRDLVCAVHPPSHGGARNGGMLELQSNAVALRLNGTHLQHGLGSQPLHHLI